MSPQIRILSIIAQLFRIINALFLYGSALTDAVSVKKWVWRIPPWFSFCFLWFFGFCFLSNPTKHPKNVGLLSFFLDFFLSLVYSYDENLRGGDITCWQQKDAA
jgi:hypothetical protein